MAAKWKISGDNVVPQSIDEVSTTQKMPLGTRVWARDVDTTTALGECEFIYVKGVTSGAAGLWAGYNQDDYTTTLAVADGIYPLGIMMSALSSATATFGFLQIYGKVSQAKCLTSFADNGRVFLTACAGYVDDTSVAGDRVNNAKGASTSTARKADFEIYYPYVNDATSAGG